MRDAICVNYPYQVTELQGFAFITCMFSLIFNLYFIDNVLQYIDLYENKLVADKHASNHSWFLETSNSILINLTISPNLLYASGYVLASISHHHIFVTYNLKLKQKQQQEFILHYHIFWIVFLVICFITWKSYEIKN